jgi:hypothetical protein
MSKEAVAKQSGHKPGHVLALLADPSPNPSLRLYLDLLDAAGARFAGVDENTTRAVVEHFAAVMEERDISTSKLARLADVNRAQLSTLLNDPDPNPKLAVIDRIVEALEIEDEFGLVSATVSGDSDEDEAEVDENEEEVDDEDAAEEDEIDDEEVDDDEVDEDEVDDDEVDDDEIDDEEVDDDEVDDDDEEVDDDEDEVDDDEGEDEVDEDEVDDDQAAADDIAAEQAEQIRTLQQQNAALQRQVQQNQAELSELKGKKPWWRTALEVATGAAALGGAAYLVTRPPPKK